MKAVIIARLIFALDASPEIKHQITECVFYGTIAGTVNLMDKYLDCKATIIRRANYEKK